MTVPNVVLYTRDGCHLCDDAHALFKCGTAYVLELIGHRY